MSCAPLPPPPGPPTRPSPAAIARDRVVAICRLTQLGLLWLLCNAELMGARRRTHATAWRDVQRILAQPAVTYLAEPMALDQILADHGRRTGTSPGFWTDAYLAAFAEAAAVGLVTLDRGLRRYSKRIALTLLS